MTIEAHVGYVMDMPPELAERITWSAPDKIGSEIAYDPPSRQGPDITITYTGLPASNDEFGPTTITASVDTGGSCGTLSASQTVRLFYPRDARNNPAGDAPNYFFMYDEHHLTYSVAEQWPKGAADRQDWAKPGTQWR